MDKNKRPGFTRLVGSYRNKVDAARNLRRPKYDGMPSDIIIADLCARNQMSGKIGQRYCDLGCRRDFKSDADAAGARTGNRREARKGGKTHDRGLR
jgi:hypothetical protein